MQKKFIEACRMGKLDEVKEIVQNPRERSVLQSLNNLSFGALNEVYETQRQDDVLQLLRARNFEAVRSAADNGHLETLKYLFSLCSTDEQKFDMLRPYGFAPLSRAARNRDTITLDYLLSICSHDLKIEIINTTRLLEDLAEFGHLETFKKLWSLCSEDRKNAIQKNIESNLLIKAARGGHIEILEYFLSPYPTEMEKFEILKSLNFYPFIEAAGGGHIETLEYFLHICSTDAQRLEMLSACYFQAFAVAAKHGRVKTMETLWAICPDKQKLNMLNLNGHNRPVSLAARYGRVESLEYLWSICPEDKKFSMPNAIFVRIPELFVLAAENGHVETLKYLWSICPDDQKSNMLEHYRFEALTKAAENGKYYGGLEIFSYHSAFEYILSLCNQYDKTEALSTLGSNTRATAKKMLAQRKEILEEQPSFDIDAFNSIFEKITLFKNSPKEGARFLLTCTKLYASTAFPEEIFLEILSYSLGENIHKPLIKDALEAASLVIQEGYDVRSPEAFLRARQIKFGLNKNVELDQYIHSENGSGCVIS